MMPRDRDLWIAVVVLRRFLAPSVRVSTIRIRPDELALHAGAYAGVVASVEAARDELLAVLAASQAALGGAGQGATAELRSAVQHGFDVLVHDHQQLQVGLAAVASCVRELDGGLFR